MAPLVWQAWQSWKSAKAVALLVILAFTAGIGSITAIYTVINALLLKPLPYQHGERYVSILGATVGDADGMSGLSLDDVFEYQQRARSFDVFGWLRFANYNLTAPGQPLYISGVGVTPQLANSLGVSPELGRWFREKDTAPAAVISHPLWVRMGADPSIVGQTITLSGRIYEVDGVMPLGFSLPLEGGGFGDSQIDVWLPLDPLGRAQNRNEGVNFCYARLRQGVSIRQAEAEVKRIASEIAKRDPVSRAAYTARLDSLRELTTKDVKPSLLLLFAAAWFLLFITCANVCGLLLARSVARARETAVRVALGAGLRQLFLQYMLEGLFVSLPGAAGGLLFSAAVSRMLIAFAGDASARVYDLRMDWRVLTFALATALLTAALTGMAPLWQAMRIRPNEVLSDGAHASAATRSRRLAQWLVGAEIALAFTLLTLGAVLVFELHHITRIWPGFDPDHLLTFRLTFEQDAVPGKTNPVSYQKSLMQAVESIPGISAAGFINQLPLVGCCYVASVFPEAPAAQSKAGQSASLLFSSTGYIHAMRIPLRRGRFLNEHDTNGKLIPVLIDEAAARRIWRNQDPMGGFGHLFGPKGTRFQVVGVVGNVKNNGLDSATWPELYVPAAIMPANPMSFVVRSPLPAKTLVPEIRRAIQRVNPGQPVYDVMTMNEIVAESVMMKRLASYVMSFFALAALLMATLGTYGLVSYTVRLRTVEFGTRMALGAVSGDLLRLVLGSGLKLAMYGVAIGGVVSVGAVWLLVHQMDIQNVGYAPFVIPAVVVAAVAVASSFFPAWRATLLSPMVAIRDDPGSMWETARQGIGRFFGGFSRAVSGPSDDAIPADDALMTDFVDAARQAGSFRDAIRAALESLRASTGAQSALLLQNISSEECRATMQVPDRGLSACSIPAQGLLLNRLRFHSSPLVLESEDFEVWRRWALQFNPGRLAEIETLRGTGARLAVPLRTNKEILGVLLLGAPAGRARYSPAERRLLRGCADQFALMLENARLTDRVVEQEKLRRDIALAAEVQKRLLAQQSWETPIASLVGFNLQARSVGGDYYDFLDVGEGRMGIALADVAGKGVAAALIMSVVQASLRVISAEPGISLPQLAARMNHFLYRSTGPTSYATFFYAQLNERTRELRYVNAGHNAPYLLGGRNGSAAMEELSTGGTVIGMFPRAVYEEGAIPLCPGDLLMIFTDGVTEALNPGDEEFGEERIKCLLRGLIDLPLAEISARIVGELKSWIQDAAQYDDITFVLMKVK